MARITNMKTKEIKRIIAKPAPYDAWFRATYWEIVGKWVAPTAEELNELAELTRIKVLKQHV